jgi:glycosyltransferase involved in cell wall biosynthesis
VVEHVRVKSVAIIGSRGIPATYGGFERIVDVFAPMLAKSGWEVFVSCEGKAGQEKMTSYKGVNLFYFPIRPFFRTVYEVLYDIYSLVWSSLRCDCIYILGYGAALFFFIPKLFFKPLVVNVDGLEWRRNKFNCVEKIILHVSERIAVMFADGVIADSLEIRNYLEKKYGREVVYISYGADPEVSALCHGERLPENDFMLGNEELTRGNYWLAIARMELENNIHRIITSFLASGSDRKLIVVGDFSSKKYEKRINDIVKSKDASGKVVLPGGIYDRNLLNTLRQNCFAYIHGHSVGGTNPSLLEAMSAGCLIAAHDNVFNREVGEGALLYFTDAADLASVIADVEKNPELFSYLKKDASSRAIARYSWKDAVDKYDRLFNYFCNEQ